MEPLQLEIIYSGHQCPSSFYMAQAVEDVAPAYGDHLKITKIEYSRNKDHARRLYDLSVALYGEEAVRTGQKIAPIPSIFINSELVFNMIPPRYELIDAIKFFLLQNELPLSRAVQ